MHTKLDSIIEAIKSHIEINGEKTLTNKDLLHMLYESKRIQYRTNKNTRL